jgi:beta-1,4-mannosyl-glycoprotein beta-1,4-N-acetylglucosaminyltransferase
MIFDCFMLLDELDMLTCRLIELYDYVDAFIIVECGETHQGAPKRSAYLAHEARFLPWRQKIIPIWVPKLRATTAIERDQEQREAFRHGLERVHAKPDDVVLQSDLDEIPSREAVRQVSTWLSMAPAVSFRQRLHCFAVDWEHPWGWNGPVAMRYGAIGSFSEMRERRSTAQQIAGGGHHLSWLGGRDATVRKIEAFAHPEILNQRPDLVAQKNFLEGIHVDGVKMTPVDIDDSYPEFIKRSWDKGLDTPCIWRCPPNWFRERKAMP